MPTRQARRHRERGAALVEFALVLPLLILMVSAIVDFGFRYAEAAQINNAALVAARDMTIHNDVGHAQSAATSAGAPAGSSIDVSPGSCAADTDITVTIAATLDTPTGAFGETFDVTGKAVARCTE